METRKVFVVGRRDRGSTTVVLVRVANGPIVGPWTLKAVVSRN